MEEFGTFGVHLMLEILVFFSISLLIGFLIGIEREHSHAEGLQAIGVRTFILFALMGTLAATINQLPFTITSNIFIFSLILLSYYRSTAKHRKKIDIGITTELAAGIIYCLGYIVPKFPLLAITISAFVLLVLMERERLHILARQKFKPHEIETITLLIIFALGILPILPNQSIDAWGLFNPRNFGILVLTVATIQFTGYVAIRLFGERFGIALLGFFGGLISSTAVYASLNDTLRHHPNSVLAVMAAALLAVVAMLVEVIAIIFVASPTFLTYIIKPLLVMIMVGILISIILLHYQKIKQLTSQTLPTPLNLSSLLRTSIFIAATLLLIAITKRYVGEEGILLISFLGGLFEIHGLSLATALLYLDNHLKISEASTILYVAIFATFVSKLFLLWIFTPKNFAFFISIFLLGVLGSGAAMYWISL